MSRQVNIRNYFTRQKQMSESMLLNLLLAFSGGFQDAYTYIVRDKVFANAQTGNIVLMSTYLMEGKWQRGFMYLFPVFSFMLGIFISDSVQHRFRAAKKLHWRQGIVLAEIAIMVIVGFLPLSVNMLANCMISFSCALQVQSFRKLHGNAYASTMCIGNLRSGVSAFSNYLRTRDAQDLSKARDYIVVIVVFALGAGIGGNSSLVLGEKTIWTTVVPLMICFLMMGLDNSNTEAGEGKR